MYIARSGWRIAVNWSWVQLSHFKQDWREKVKLKFVTLKFHMTCPQTTCNHMWIFCDNMWNLYGDVSNLCDHMWNFSGNMWNFMWSFYVIRTHLVAKMQYTDVDCVHLWRIFSADGVVGAACWSPFQRSRRSYIPSHRLFRCCKLDLSIFNDS